MSCRSTHTAIYSSCRKGSRRTPPAATGAEPHRVVEKSTMYESQAVIGYILRHHPCWVDQMNQSRHGQRFVMRTAPNQPLQPH
ncbi:unnamed protein product [Penicillium roqueforti FM164]|uniref:Genomic scaffold, ProqFM164S01 n=1 Tax=Penicillium roqueforti (strain FM164) TaxID=1365484 RepID=W6PXK1_PENRF|nr:unnamed protein product [Penicillium roqueforti FM164]